jgi:adenylate cyclase
MAIDNINLFSHLEQLIKAGIDPTTREAEIWERYGRTVAVLILDSSGFSRVSETHGVLHFLSRLMLMRQAVQAVMGANQVLQMDFEADNVFAVFADPDDAIRAALQCHTVVAQNGIMLTDDEAFKVCIGIGYGPMLYSETLEGYFAKEMNFASKLGEDTADGGETLLTENAYANASAELVKDFEEARCAISGLDLVHYRHRC